MENKEGILTALEGFNSTADIDIKEIPEILEKLIVDVAKTGETVFPWQKLKSLFMFKIDTAMKNFQESISMDKLSPIPNVENVKFDVMRKRILERLAEFSGAPFTIQRLAELVVDPKKHYKRTDKFLRAVEKNVMVVSTVDPYGNKIVSDTKLMMNGDMNGSLLDRNSSLFMPPAPMNSPATSAALSRADEGSPLPAWPQKAMDSAVSTSTSIPQASDSDSQPFNPVTVFPSQSTVDESSSNTENKPMEETSSASGNISQHASGDNKENENKSKGSSDFDASAETEDGSSQGSDSSEKSDTSVSSLSSDENTPPSKEKIVPSEIASQESSASTNDSECDSQKSIQNGQTLKNSAISLETASTNEQNTQMETDEKSDSESAAEEESPKSKEDESLAVVSKGGAAQEQEIEDSSKREAEVEVHEDTPASKKRKSDQMSPIDTPPCKKINTDEMAALDQTAHEIDSRRESCGFETHPNLEENDSVEQSTEQSVSMTTQDADVTSSSDTQKTLGAGDHKMDSSSTTPETESVKSSEVRSVHETEREESKMGVDVKDQESNVDSSKPESCNVSQSSESVDTIKSSDADSSQS